MPNHFKSLALQIFGLFAVLAIFVGIILFFGSFNRTKLVRPKYFIVINSHTGYADKGFQQEAILGACATLGITPAKCNRANPRFKKNILFGYPNTTHNAQIIYEYILEQNDKYKVKNFILPGFTYTAFLNQYIRDPKLLAKKIKIISVDTFFDLGDKTWPNNLYESGFRSEYSGFNAGLYAGLTALLNPGKFKDFNPTKSGQQIAFAILGGMKIPAIFTYAVGFKHGIQTINASRQQIAAIAKANGLIPSAQPTPELVFYKFDTLGGFDSKLYGADAKKKANQLFQQRVSVLFSIAVSLTNYIHDAARDQNYREGRKQNWVVGVDVDQEVTYFGATGWKSNPNLKSFFVTSAIINVREQVKNVLTAIQAQQAGSKKKVGNLDTEIDLIQIPKRLRNIANPTWKLWQLALTGPNGIVVHGRKLAKMPYETKIRAMIDQILDPNAKSKLWAFLDSSQTVAAFEWN